MKWTGGGAVDISRACAETLKVPFLGREKTLPPEVTRVITVTLPLYLSRVPWPLLLKLKVFGMCDIRS